MSQALTLKNTPWPLLILPGLPYDHYLSALRYLGDAQRECLIACDHPAVVTCGRAMDANHNPFISGQIPVPLLAVNRGGQATAHEPGQLVFYPSIRLQHRAIRPGDLVHALQASALDLLETYSADLVPKPNFTRIAGKPGIYCEINGQPSPMWPKIASVGIAIKRGMIQHGISVNIFNALRTVRAIRSCGEDERPQTSLAEIHPRLKQRIREKALPSELYPPAPAIRTYADLWERIIDDRQFQGTLFFEPGLSRSIAESDGFWLVLVGGLMARLFYSRLRGE